MRPVCLLILTPLQNSSLTRSAGPPSLPRARHTSHSFQALDGNDLHDYCIASLSMTTAANAFHCFPRLPKELRQAIWRACLPSRVLEMDVPYAYLLARDLPEELEGTVGCNLHDTTGDNAMPPMITRVCSESREVAFETGRFIDIRDLWDGSSVNTYAALPTPWFDSARDAVHLHWSPSYETEWMTTCSDPLPVLLSLGAEAARGASITWDGVCSYDYTMDLLKQAAQSYMLCLSPLVSIHASDVDAVQSGLFGSVGEERVVMVDADDCTRIRLFDDFNRVYGSSKDRQTSHFFQRWRASGAEDVKREMQDCKVSLLMSRSVYAAPKWEKEELDAVWSSTPWKSTDQETSLQSWVPNWDHGWVQSVLRDMPPFRPVYMMRLCTGNCT